VQILRDLLGLEAVTVDTLPDGSMDAHDLAKKLKANADFPALVVPTVGTTFRGAVDNLDQIQKQLKGYSSYVHLDAALFGGYLPFTSNKRVVAHQGTDPTGPTRYDSIAVSCHKFFGFPSPAGIFVTRQNLYEQFNELFSQIHNPEYIHHVPGTITCSRDAVKPAEFYYFATPAAQAQQVKDARQMLRNTTYLLDAMQSRFPDSAAARSNPLSNTVFFRNPGEETVQKYSLATMHLESAGRSELYAHVVVMPHVTRKVIDDFLTDLTGK
jgi:histidine decarboxylase